MSRQPVTGTAEI